MDVEASTQPTDYEKAVEVLKRIGVENVDKLGLLEAIYAIAKLYAMQYKNNATIMTPEEFVLNLRRVVKLVVENPFHDRDEDILKIAIYTKSPFLDKDATIAYRLLLKKLLRIINNSAKWLEGSPNRHRIVLKVQRLAEELLRSSI